jgi:hypothetical protein
LLNFSAYPEWHTEWLKEIKVQDSNKTPQTLTNGDKIAVNIENFKFVAEVKVTIGLQPTKKEKKKKKKLKVTFFRRTPRPYSLGRARLSSPLLVCINSIWSQRTMVLRLCLRRQRISRAFLHSS